MTAAIAPWAQYGALGGVIVLLLLANVFQWRRGEKREATIDLLNAARLADIDKCTNRFIDILVQNLATNNRMADGMEAFERVVDKIDASAKR